MIQPGAHNERKRFLSLCAPVQPRYIYVLNKQISAANVSDLVLIPVFEPKRPKVYQDFDWLKLEDLALSVQRVRGHS